jgi:leader peptidase (prepilin peptidase)/N-methyltransferase
MTIYFVLLLSVLIGFVVRPIINWFIFRKTKNKQLYLKKNWTYILCIISAICGIVYYKIFGLGLQFWVILFISFTTIILSIIDIRIRKIPNEILIFMLVSGVFFHMTGAENITFSSHIAGLLIGLGIFLLGDVISGGKKVGKGDIKLAASIGFFTGSSVVLPTLLIAALSVTLIGGLLILKGKLQKNVPIPYAPFLMLGLFIQILVNIKN